MKFGTDEVSCYGFFRKRARVTESATTSSSDQASGGCELAILKLQDSMNKISQQNQEVRALLMEIKKDVTAIKGASLEYGSFLLFEIEIGPFFLFFICAGNFIAPCEISTKIDRKCQRRDAVAHDSPNCKPSDTRLR